MGARAAQNETKSKQRISQKSSHLPKPQGNESTTTA